MFDPDSSRIKLMLQIGIFLSLGGKDSRPSDFLRKKKISDFPKVLDF